ncbi:protein jag [Aquipuribacter sp. MA13-6]|uniref:Jag family protein n=1 Tax=unclassified Aquipuribacter TaxID=2635084 RepID=UPI003EED9565
MDTTADSTAGAAAPEAVLPEDETTEAPATTRERSDSPEPSNKQKLLDQEGDAAADYLEELLDIADLDGDIDIFVENGRASVAVLADKDDADGLAVLVGPEGEVLDALQELTRLAAQARTGERSRLLLDIAGWREGRRTTAAAIAKEAIDRVRSQGESIELEPMPAYQRKAVHDAVADAGLRSDSDGVEPRRFVVIHPA